jgi:hypothetical protein
MKGLLLQWACFLLLGVAQVFFLRRWVSRVGKHNSLFSVGAWLFTGFLSLVLTLLVFYFFGKGQHLRIAVASFCAFLLPFTLAHAWHIFSGIPAPRYKLWFIPEVMYQWGGRMRQKIPVTVRLKRRYFDRREEVFTLTAPAMVKLGSVFHSLIAERQNEEGSQEEGAEPYIELNSKDHRPFGWEFYAARYGGLIKTRLDPERTLTENRIKSNHIVIVRRTQTTTSHET